MLNYNTKEITILTLIEAQFFVAIYCILLYQLSIPSHVYGQMYCVNRGKFQVRNFFWNSKFNVFVSQCLCELQHGCVYSLCSKNCKKHLFNLSYYY